ncbi:MAG: DUF4194 domain-containing protein [Bacilli bacterium]|jgi:hypothetical protein|nr:DUF4194 domain-containing protein [Bacilli bacterium]
MFTEEYEKLSRGDRTLFSEVVNDLLFQCYIVRRGYDRKSKMFRAEPNYLFIERYYSMIEEYLSYMDLQLTKNDEDGVIFVTSGADRNHVRFDPTTTLIVFALRSFYEGQLEKKPEESEVLMTSSQLNSLVSDMGLSSLSKRLSSSTISTALRVLDGFNVVCKANNSYGDPSYSFFIMPTIRYVISSEKLNALYSLLTEAPEEEEHTLLSDALAENNIAMGQDIPVRSGGDER